MNKPGTRREDRCVHDAQPLGPVYAKIPVDDAAKRSRRGPIAARAAGVVTPCGVTHERRDLLGRLARVTRLFLLRDEAVFLQLVLSARQPV